MVSVGVFLAVVFLVTFASIIKTPVLPRLELESSDSRGAGILINRKNNIGNRTDSTSASLAVASPGKTEATKTEAGNGIVGIKKTKVLAYFVNWDDNSFTSLKKNINSIDILIPEWLHLGEQIGEVILDDFQRQEEVLLFISENKKEIEIMPLINNFNENSQQWDGEMLARMLSSADARKRAVDNIYSFVKSNGFMGISVDFENMPEGSQGNLYLFMQELYGKFQPEGLMVTQNIPLGDDSFDVVKLSKVSDYLILMSYDEHYAGGEPGPISSNLWYVASLNRIFSQIPSNKFIVALGGYGYDWTEGEDVAKALSFQDAMRIASDSGAEIVFGGNSLNPTFNYYDAENKLHRVWYLDAVTVFNGIVFGNKAGNPYGYALWRLGSEDPDTWEVFDAGENLKLSTVKKLGIMEYGLDLVYEGKGEILKVASYPKNGLRKLTFNVQSGTITKESILKYPASYEISRWGGTEDKKIALTFDDGPDRVYTPKILDILNQYRVPATFFVIGVNANVNTDILKRIYNEGSEIGIHTYSHPDISAITPRQFRFELDASQRLIESVLSRKSLLFRPPYAEDVEPEFSEQVGPLVTVNSLGYYTIGMHIDPEDWRGIKSSDIISNTVGDVLDGKGNIILLHDSGGDRSQTVEALPGIIQELQKNGYQFVTVSDLMGIGRDAAMPLVQGRELFLSRINSAAFSIVGHFSSFMRTMFVVGIFLGTVRFFYLSILAVIQRIHSKRAPYKKLASGYLPQVSVIVPAYNEEKVVSKTVDAILNSEYRNFNIIVVDDGSEDATYETVNKKYNGNEKVEFYKKKNGGKASALNLGISKTESEIVVTLDADTLFLPDTLGNLIRAFADVRVGAVAGNAKVGNRINILTKWQALEYITGQNIEKRAFEVMNCITVVPGAVGAWRRKDVLEVGGFSDDTLAEDTDLTLGILKNGKMVIFEDEAVGLTEAPDNTKNFIKQRFRWMYGTMQSVWKHREAAFRFRYKGLGFFAIPNVLIFQIFFPLISPFLDLVMIFSLIWIGWQKYSHPISFSSSAASQRILWYYLFFLIVDIASGIIPFILEPREKKSLLLWLPLQRFYYRQLMYYVAIKSIFTAFMGKVVGWNKFERKDTVKAGQILSGVIK